MLTPEEKAAIDEERAIMPHAQAAGIEALKIVQRRHGWVTDEALQDVADYLGLSTAEVEDVATFYSMIFRRPVGRHVILICDGVSCWVVGYEELIAALTERLGIRPGETTPDGRFTLVPVPCLGACDHAPVLVIDGEYHLDVWPDRLDELLARYE
jgi:NADH-quinone oxidoreductase subunit E